MLGRRKQKICDSPDAFEGRVVVRLPGSLNDSDLALLPFELEDDGDSLTDLHRVRLESLLPFEGSGGEGEDVSWSDVVSTSKEVLGGLVEDEVAEGGGGGSWARRTEGKISARLVS